MATSVRVRERQAARDRRSVRGDARTTGRLFLIDAKNLDEAIAVAAKIPMARKGTVEVRPVIEIPNLP